MSRREYPSQPICGVGIICFKGDRVLLVRRAKPPITRQWSIPGGGQELGETTRAAALRELEEETGVTARLTGLVDVVDAIRPDDNGQLRFHYTLVDFAAEWISGEPQAASDVSDAAWMPLDRLDELDLWSETLRVIRNAQAMRAPGAGSPPTGSEAGEKDD